MRKFIILAALIASAVPAHAQSSSRESASNQFARRLPARDRSTTYCQEISDLRQQMINLLRETKSGVDRIWAQTALHRLDLMASGTCRN